MASHIDMGPCAGPPKLRDLDWLMDQLGPTQQDEGLPRPGEPDPVDWYPVEEVFGRLCIEHGMSVALVGVRARCIGLALVRAVGRRGRVNVIGPRIAELTRFREDLPSNAPVSLIGADYANTSLEKASQDLVLSVNAWHEYREPHAILAEFARILRPDAHLAIVEWRQKFVASGPPRERRLPGRQIVELVSSRGWSVSGDVPVGEHSLLIVARRPDT